MTYSNGNMLCQADYYPFGDTYGLGCAGDEYYEFAGLFHDGNGNPTLHNNEDRVMTAANRRYASSWFRWNSPDPAGVKVVSLTDPQSWNMYMYSHVNPVTFNDPSGLYACADDPKCGSKQDKAFETARQSDLKSRDPKVVKAAKAYGDPTKNNGVTVGFVSGKWGATHVSVTWNGKSVSSSITVSIPKSDKGVGLDGEVGHEGTHVELDQALVASVTPSGSYNHALDISSFASEMAAYSVQATIWQSSGNTWSMNGTGGYIVKPGDSPQQVNQTIQQFLADPSNKYNLTPQNPGPPIVVMTGGTQ